MKNDFTSTKELALANNNTEAKFANLLTDLSNIRASGVDLFSEACPDVLHGEAEDFVYGINVAASAVAHIAAPEDYERSNRFLKSAGLDDLAEDPIGEWFILRLEAELFRLLFLIFHQIFVKFALVNHTCPTQFQGGISGMNPSCGIQSVKMKMTLGTGSTGSRPCVWCSSVPSEVYIPSRARWQDFVKPQSVLL